MEKQNRIIKGALDLFMQKGVKGVNMDDVSNHLGISKKTLYQFVRNKEDLVEKSFVFHHNRIKTMIDGIRAKNENPIDEFFDITEGVCNLMKKRNPSFILDLKKYYPKVWEITMYFRRDNIVKTISNNIMNGIEKGLYRNDLKIEIITKLMLNKIEAIVSEEVFPLTEYNFRELVDENRVYHIRGIATLKGLKYLENKLKKLK